MHEAPTSVSALQTLKTRFGCLVLIFVRRIHWAADQGFDELGICLRF